MAKKYFCKDCGEEKSKKGIYCKVCRYKYARRPSGLKYNIKVKNKAWFKKGDVPWNEGKELPYDVWNKGTKGLCKPNITSFKAEDVTGEKNSKWKGEDVGTNWGRVGDLQQAEIEGYDVVIIEDADTGYGITDEIVVFDDDNIKIDKIIQI